MINYNKYRVIVYIKLISFLFSFIISFIIRLTNKRFINVKNKVNNASNMESYFFDDFIHKVLIEFDDDFL